MKKESAPLKNYIHYATVPSRMAIALDKRKETIRSKYTDEEISQIATKRTKIGYNKINESVNNAAIYPREEFIDKIANIQIKQFLGKSGNRKLIKYDPALYKSLIHYTEFLKPYVNRIWFALRLKIADNKLCLPTDDSMWCICRSKLSYDPATSDYTKRFCAKCKISPGSKEYFKFLYQDNWESKYNEFKHSPQAKKAQQLAGRNSWYSRKGKKFAGCLCKGKNETVILDFIEKVNSIKISRGFPILGYYVDGYCVETNTVYEVYEKHHTSNATQRKYDSRRQEDIINYLQCNFVIIYDPGTTLELDQLKIQYYNVKN